MTPVSLWSCVAAALSAAAPVKRKTHLLQHFLHISLFFRRAFDRHTRACALTRVFTMYCMYNGQIIFTSKPLWTLFKSVRILRKRECSSCGQPQKLTQLLFGTAGFHCWYRLSYHLHLFSVRMFFMSLIIFFPTFSCLCIHSPSVCPLTPMLYFTPPPSF